MSYFDRGTWLEKPWLANYFTRKFKIFVAYTQAEKGTGTHGKCKDRKNSQSLCAVDFYIHAVSFLSPTLSFYKIIGFLYRSRKYLHPSAMLCLYQSQIRSEKGILIPYLEWSCPILPLQTWWSLKAFTRPCKWLSIFNPSTPLRQKQRQKPIANSMENVHT